MGAKGTTKKNHKYVKREDNTSTASKNKYKYWYSIDAWNNYWKKLSEKVNHPINIQSDMSYDENGNLVSGETVVTDEETGFQFKKNAKTGGGVYNSNGKVQNVRVKRDTNRYSTNDVTYAKYVANGRNYLTKIVADKTTGKITKVTTKDKTIDNGLEKFLVLIGLKDDPNR